MEEIFKDVPEYEGYYQVSNLGNIKSLSISIFNGNGYYMSKEKLLNPYKNDEDYLVVNFRKNNISKQFKVHQVVAMAFLGHIPNMTNKIVVDHINNIQLDNRLENLQIITQRENASKDKKNTSSKYTGVCFYKNKWKSVIRIEKQRFSLGSFKDEIDARNAYQKALKNWEESKIKPIIEKNHTSKYKGVSWDKKSKKWKSQISINNKKIHLGFFENEEEASYVYQTKIKEIKNPLN